MSEKKTPSLSGGESPIPIPPVEEAWRLMRLDLDKNMPVRRWRDRFRSRQGRSGWKPVHSAGRTGRYVGQLVGGLGILARTGWHWVALASTAAGVSLVIWLMPHRVTGPGRQ